MKHLKKLLALLLTFTNVRKADKSSSLNDESLEEREIRKDEIIKREKVNGTPFSIIQQQDITFIALGMYKVSDNLSYKECKEVIKNKEWNLILNVARLIAMDEIAIQQETKTAIREQTILNRTNGQPKENKYK